MRLSLLDNLINRRKFDPSKREDQIELKFFLEKGRWRTICPFYVEDPWEEIPVMCMEKYARHMLGKM